MQVRLILRLPRALANVQFLYFRMRGIDPQSPEAYFWIRLSAGLGMMAAIAALVLLRP